MLDLQLHDPSVSHTPRCCGGGRGAGIFVGLSALVLCSCVRSPAPPTRRATAVVQGTLASEAGVALAGEQVMACTRRACAVESTDPEGRFSFELEAPVEVVVKTQESLDGSRRAAVMRPLSLHAGGVTRLGVLRVPVMPEGAALDPRETAAQTVSVGDHVTMTLRYADLVPKLGSVVEDISVRRLEDAHASMLPALSGESVLAVYALHPFGVHCASPIAIEVPARVPKGQEIRFRTIHELDGTFSAPIPGVADGEKAVTAAAAGIHELTWLVVSTVTRNQGGIDAPSL